MHIMTPEQRDARIKRAKAHAAADRLRAGFYSAKKDHSIGCSVGCDAIDIAGWNVEFDNPHAIVAKHDGTPEWLEKLRDTIFEGLPAARRAWWHVALAEALPDNVDLDPAYHTISIKMLERLLTRRKDWDANAYGDAVASAIEQCIEYHGDPSEEKRFAAESAAWSAESAAESAWSASAASAAESEEYEWIAEMIIDVFSSMRHGEA